MRGFGVVRLARGPAGQPGGDGVRGGLLGHAVVADHRVEAPPGVGVLRGVVGLQRGRDAALVLKTTQNGCLGSKRITLGLSGTPITVEMRHQSLQ